MKSDPGDGPAPADALARPHRDFITGSALLEQWASARRFVVLDTGFGAGHAFLATWQAWRTDPKRPGRLVYIAVEPLPLPIDDLVRAHLDLADPTLAAELRLAWPPLTPDLHRLSFEDDRVELLLGFGALRAWLPQLVAEVDAFFLAGAAMTLATGVETARLCKALGRLAAPGATLTAGSAAPGLAAGLVSAGFEVTGDRPTEGSPLTLRARFAPTFLPRRAPSRPRPVESTTRHAIVIGGGLAGCAAAAAFARHGWRSTVLERGTRIASEASGNAAGLFHGIVNAHDGVHARFNRAAALAARHSVRAALDVGVAGSAEGLLRLESTLDVSAMRDMLRRLVLPADWVQALSSNEASERAGLRVSQPCWFYPGGGWVDPAGLASAFLVRAGEFAALRLSTAVSRLERHGDIWRVLDTDGAAIAEATTVVLANAGDATRLLADSGIDTDFPLEELRGQISLAPAARLASPRLPIAGSGYLLPAIGGSVMFGATTQVGDRDPAVRNVDHDSNLAQLERLLDRPPDLTATELDGRTAWRCSARDRLPLIGAVPSAAADGTRLDLPRLVPRVPGLHVLIGLGSRGITWCTLGAALLAAGVAGSPAPVGAGLRDAVDPARFVSRRARRSAGARDG